MLVCAQLRADCETVGHALAQREHNADRWIAALAIESGSTWVTAERGFARFPDL